MKKKVSHSIVSHSVWQAIQLFELFNLEGHSIWWAIQFFELFNLEGHSILSHSIWYYQFWHNPAAIKQPLRINQIITGGWEKLLKSRNSHWTAAPSLASGSISHDTSAPTDDVIITCFGLASSNQNTHQKGVNTCNRIVTPLHHPHINIV